MGANCTFLGILRAPLPDSPHPLTPLAVPELTWRPQVLTVPSGLCHSWCWREGQEDEWESWDLEGTEAMKEDSTWDFSCLFLRVAYTHFTPWDFFSRHIVNLYFEIIVRFTCSCGKQYRDPSVSPAGDILHNYSKCHNQNMDIDPIMTSLRCHQLQTHSVAYVPLCVCCYVIFHIWNHVTAPQSKYRALSSQGSLAVPSRTSLILTSCVYCRCEVWEVPGMTTVIQTVSANDISSPPPEREYWGGRSLPSPQH